MFLRAHECRCLQRQNERFRSPESGITGDCDPPDMGSGNQNQVFCQSSIH